MKKSQTLWQRLQIFQAFKNLNETNCVGNTKVDSRFAMCIAASILIPWLNLLLCGVLPGEFLWPFSFVASITSGYVFVWAGKCTAPSGKKSVGIVLMMIAEILIISEIIAVFNGFQFISYPRWLGILCSIGTAWGALSAVLSNETRD